MPRRNEYGDNGYFVNNPDGVDRGSFNETTIPCSDEGRISFDNEKKDSVKETPTSDVKEWSVSDFKNSAGFGDAKKRSTGSAKNVIGRKMAVSATTTSATLTIAGVASAAVASAVVVVAYVATALSLAVSLFSSTLHSLTFYLEFENVDRALVLVLEGADEYYSRDFDGERYVTFDGLVEDKEYYFSVLDKETSEIKYRASFFTASRVTREAAFEYVFEGDDLLLFLSVFDLADDEFYTLGVNAPDGKSLFLVDDGGKEGREYRVEVYENDRVFVSVKLNNEVILGQWVERMQEEAGYDYENASFTWSEEAEAYTATATVPSFDPNAEPLVLPAAVTSERTEPGCETAGGIRFTATITDDYGNDYFDEKEVVLPAIGHDYGEPTFAWTAEVTGGYTATATFVCSTDPSHVAVLDAEVSEEATDAACESDGSITYTATVTMDEREYSEDKVVRVTATGHDYGKPTFAWTAEVTGGYTATATFTCKNNASHTEVKNATVTSSTLAATCDEDGNVT